MSLKQPQDGPTKYYIRNLLFSRAINIPIARKREVGKAFNLDLPDKV